MFMTAKTINPSALLYAQISYTTPGAITFWFKLFKSHQAKSRAINGS